MDNMNSGRNENSREIAPRPATAILDTSDNAQIGSAFASRTDSVTSTDQPETNGLDEDAAEVQRELEKLLQVFLYYCIHSN